jgi:DNA-directed RNA polymerase subunit beta
VKGENISEPGIPEAFKVLLKELQALALDVKVLTENGDELVIREFEDEDTQERKPSRQISQKEEDYEDFDFSDGDEEDEDEAEVALFEDDEDFEDDFGDDEDSLFDDEDDDEEFGGLFGDDEDDE